MYSTCNPIILLGYCMMGGWGGGLAIYFHLSWICMFLFLLKAYGCYTRENFKINANEKISANAARQGSHLPSMESIGRIQYHVTNARLYP